jgi:hypothetical protein
LRGFRGSAVASISPHPQCSTPSMSRREESATAGRIPPRA